MSLKIEHACPICDQNDNLQIRSFSIGYLEDNTDTLTMQCNNGHTFEAVLGIPKFAFMFENGLTAYNSEFYFEAFSCFYSALELFRVDFIKAFYSEIHGYSSFMIDEQLSYIKLSERIYGIYMLCFSLYFNEKADKKSSSIVGNVALPDKAKTLRNSVVHAGKIISKEECRELGSTLYNYIRTIYQKFELPSSHDESLTSPYPAIYSYYAKKSAQIKSDGSEIVIISSDTLTSIELTSVLDLENLPKFEELLKKNANRNINKDGAEYIVKSITFKQ